MQLGEVEAFLQVARRGTLSRAASALFVTQPALTARLQRLEADLGEPVFLRSPRGMRLTEAGRAFLPYAERALEELDAGRRLVQNLGSGRAGELAIGAAPAVSTYVLPGVLKRLAAEYPNVQL